MDWLDTYTPSLDEEYESDETDYSPPFRPLDGALGPEDDDDEEDKMFHAIPVDTHTPADEDEGIEPHPASGSPHDPLSDEAKGAIAADDDFTEITQGSSANDDDEESEVVDNGSGVTSFETDPDAALTTYCAEGYPDKPIVQYALTIDAGSTGSRIHVYKFNTCGPSPQLEYETFKAVQPGLSAYARDPTAAAASLDPLLQEAIRVVPVELRKCTPVEVKATAGLRLLGEQESGAILDEVRNRLETEFDFVVGGEKAVEIMDGKDEGE
jgi:guanosine-diphosphatase